MRWFSHPGLGTKPAATVAYHECGICGEAPTAPHQGACDHVFCYYCIKVKDKLNGWLINLLNDLLIG